MLKQVLERKKALLQSIQDEDVARRKLIAALQGIEGMVKECQGEDAGSSQMKASLRGLNDIVDDLLMKKKGAQFYEKQLYIECEKAKAVLAKHVGQKTSGSSPAQEAGDKSVSSSPANNSSTTPPPTSPALASQQTTKLPKLKASTVGLMKFAQVAARLKENFQEDQVDNLKVLLGRLENVKNVTAKMVEETKVGKVVAKLSKHRMREIRDLAFRVMTNLKKCIKASEAQKSGKSSSPTPSPSSSSALKWKKTKEKDEKRKRDYEKREKEAGLKRKQESEKRSHDKLEQLKKKKKAKHTPSSKYDNSESEEVDDDDEDEWFRKRREKLMNSSEFYERENEHSTLHAELEDDAARLQEIREQKRRLMKSKK